MSTPGWTGARRGNGASADSPALPNQQRTVLTLRFFETTSQSEIGERIGSSQMHISRLPAKALDALRSEVREPALAVTA